MSQIPPEGIFKSYDIRGIYPDQINEENVVVSTRAIYAFFLKQFPARSASHSDAGGPEKDQLTVVVGRDMRASSPALFKAVTETLVELGAHVIDPGLVSTPTFYFAVFNGGYDTGIQITASHNPKQYNGLKIVVNPKNGGLIKVGKPTGMEDIKALAVGGEKFEAGSGIGKITKIDGVGEREVENALKIMGNPKLNSYKVVADAANAMGALYIEKLYQHIPGELVKLYFELDGDFPNHAADPLDSKNNEDVEKKVEEEGGVTEITKVGHALITEMMNKGGGIFAGESSAHYFFRDTGNAEGPLLVLLHVLNAMTKSGKKLSELAAEVIRSRESGEMNFRVKNAKEIIAKLKELHADGEISEIDGVAVQYPDWRFSIRSSNTEPLLRLNVEEEIENYQGRHEKLIELIKEHAQFDEESSGH